MTRSEAIAILKGRMAKYTGTDLDTSIINEMQLAQIELEGGVFWPWFMLTTEQSFATSAGVPNVAIPSNPRFQMEWEEGAMWFYDASNTDEPYQEIGKDDYDDLRCLYPGTGQPKGYDIQGEQIWFAPTPDAAYQYRWYYYSRQTVLDSDIENSWLLHAPDWLIAKTGVRIARSYVKDAELVGAFADDEQRAMNRVMTLHTARNEAQKRRIMGRIHRAS